MTIDEIADYCQFKGCAVRVGSPDSGFVEVDGNGIRRSNNYRRFQSLNEMAGAPSPARIVETATVFKIRRGSEEKVLDGEEFRAELERFLSVMEG